MTADEADACGRVLHAQPGLVPTLAWCSHGSAPELPGLMLRVLRAITLLTGLFEIKFLRPEGRVRIHLNCTQHKEGSALPWAGGSAHSSELGRQCLLRGYCEDESEDTKVSISIPLVLFSVRLSVL